jgi:hypothetical protein
MKISDLRKAPRLSKANGILEQYNAIAWDVDETLVNSEASIICQLFILTHPEIDHYIVTARSGNYQVNSILPEISSYGLGITEKNFKKIITSDHEKHTAFQIARQYRATGKLTGPLTPIEIYEYTIKGKVCDDLGIPILVDDNIARSKMGTDKYGIKIVHPLALL